MEEATENTELAKRALRVQIVEDERIVALDLQSCLEQLGFEVVGIAATVEAAVKLAGETLPDLVLMDIHLDNGGDGVSAATQIRDRFSLPVVFLSAFGETEVLARAAGATPFGYLLKPFELRELNATVRMAVVRRREEARTESAQRRLQLALESGSLTVLELEDGSGQLNWSGQPLSTELAGLAEADELEQVLAGLDEAGREAFERLIQSGDPVDLICRWHDAPNAPRWLDMHARYFDVERRVMGVVRDVTAKVESDTRLRQALVVFDSTDEAILFLDEHKRVLGCNRAFRQLMGWDESEVLGRRPEDFLYARRQEDWGETRPMPPGHELLEHNEVILRRADASLFPAHENLREVHDSNGRVTHHVLRLSDISEIRATQSQLRHQTLHDALTGLANRTRLQEALHERCANAPGASFELLLVDLDGFKAINESLGHDLGDELLIAIALRLQGLLRRDDLAARLGGDEFVVMMGEPRRASDPPLAAQLLAAISEPVLLGDQTVTLTASIGVARYPEDASEPRGLLKAAEAAMYDAKARGRNRSAAFDRALADGAAEQLRLEQGLRRALELGQLSLHWQPMINMRAGHLLGAEVLLRWNHPELGSVSPARFIPLAEATGLICPIGAWVLDQACAQAAAWLAAGKGLARVAVNISVRQFEEEDMLHVVKQTLQRHGLPPERLEIEVTESMLGNSEAMRKVLGSLRDLGVAVSLDDFGTGFSSLGQLKSLPIDRLKIDRSFVSDLSDDAHSRAIAQAIVTLAQSLGLDITAEGVETPAQRDVLLALGAHEAQGWLYHRSMSAEQLEALLPDMVSPSMAPG